VQVALELQGLQVGDGGRAEAEPDNGEFTIGVHGTSLCRGPGGRTRRSLAAGRHRRAGGRTG
jgi:hypothetical protein